MGRGNDRQGEMTFVQISSNNTSGEGSPSSQLSIFPFLPLWLPNVGLKNHLTSLSFLTCLSASVGMDSKKKLIKYCSTPQWDARNLSKSTLDFQQNVIGKHCLVHIKKVVHFRLKISIRLKQE